jgi:hypothetical protein
MSEIPSRDRHWPCSREEWFRLPLHLRQRWWRETEFDRSEPSAELLAEVAGALRGAS